MDNHIEIIKRCKLCGMDDYLSKPLSMEKMIQVVKGQFALLEQKINSN